MLQLLITLAASLSSSENTNEISLAWKFEKGMTLSYERKTTLTRNEEDGGKLSYTFTWRVTDVNEMGVATIRRTWDRVVMYLPGADKPSYDSERDRSAPENRTIRFFASFVGKASRISISRDGRIVSSKGLRLARKEAHLAALRLPETDVLKGTLPSEEDLRLEIQHNWVGLPSMPVTVGSEWKSYGRRALTLWTIRLKSSHRVESVNRAAEQAIIRRQVVEYQAVQHAEVPEQFKSNKLVEFAQNSRIVWDIGRGVMKERKGELTQKHIVAGKEVSDRIIHHIRLLPE